MMFGYSSYVNPHRQIDALKLAKISDLVLQDLITLRRSAPVPALKWQHAGAPPLSTLEAEARRRNLLGPGVS